MSNTLTDTEKSKDLSRLLDISLTMIEKTDLSSLLGLIMEEATKTMNADRSTLYLVDRERNELVSFIAQQSGIKEIRLPLGMGIAGYVAETGKTVNIENARLHEEREKTFLRAIKALSAAIDRRDPVTTATAGHSERVARLSVDMGKTLGLTKNELKMLNYAATLHDVGKIGVRDNVFLKLDIIRNEAENNHLDTNIVKLFIEKKGVS